MRVGVLALQGGYAAHRESLAALGHEYVEVRAAGDLRDLGGLILPGGESTAQLKQLAKNGLGPALAERVAAGVPVLATCAGVILAAKEVQSPSQQSLGWLDVTVARNAYGRQLHSREAVSACGLPLVFIRAPRILRVGPEVEVLDHLADDPVLVRQDNFFGATFHPELTDSLAVHRQVFGRNLDHGSLS